MCIVGSVVSARNKHDKFKIVKNRSLKITIFHYCFSVFAHFRFSVASILTFLFLLAH